MKDIVIQKLVAAAGVASRHAAEKLIKDGRVKVNGRVARLGDRASEQDAVTVNGKPLAFTKDFVYIKLYKPVGVVSTTRSFPGEKNILELVNVQRQLAIVGRLDKDSEGLVLLTDDGDLAYKLTHPKFGVPKVYVVTLEHDIDKKKIKDIQMAFVAGVDIGTPFAKASEVKGREVVRAQRVKHMRGRTFEIVLQEGKKRQIRRMFRKMGCHVAKLIRVRIGRVTIGGLKRGEWKYLNKQEIQNLKDKFQNKNQN